jgi:hypothetical protein
MTRPDAHRHVGIAASAEAAAAPLVAPGDSAALGEFVHLIDTISGEDVNEFRVVVHRHAPSVVAPGQVANRPLPLCQVPRYPHEHRKSTAMPALVFRTSSIERYPIRTTPSWFGQ